MTDDARKREARAAARPQGTPSASVSSGNSAQRGLVARRRIRLGSMPSTGRVQMRSWNPNAQHEQARHLGRDEWAPQLTSAAGHWHSAVGRHAGHAVLIANVGSNPEIVRCRRERIGAAEGEGWRQVGAGDGRACRPCFQVGSQWVTNPLFLGLARWAAAEQSTRRTKSA